MATTPKIKDSKLVKAFARDLRISPRKLRLVTNMVNGLPVDAALTQLQFTNKKGAPMVAKLIKSAIANAENNFSLDASSLFIKSITCDMGKVMSRYFPRARGSAFVIRRKMAHVNVILEPRSSVANKNSRFALLRKPKKTEDKKLSQVSQEETPGREAALEKPLADKKFKTNEQVKASKIQQKRRLFNRKSGE